MSNKNEYSFNTKKVIKISVIAIVAIFALITLFSSFTTIKSGEIGLKSRFGEIVSQTTQEGIQFKVPFVEKVTKVNMKVQKADVTSSSATKDLQDVSISFAINFQLSPEKVMDLYKKIGQNYVEIILQPATQEALKNVTSKYTAEELITKRSEVSQQIIEELSAKVGKYGIIINELNIIDLNFSEAYNKAIEDKQVAEQEVKKAQQELEKTKIEAEKKVAEAKAQADALKLQKEEITPELLELRRIEAQLKAIEKWSGNLPTTITGSDGIPFIDLK